MRKKGLPGRDAGKCNIVKETALKSRSYHLRQVICRSKNYLDQHTRTHVQRTSEYRLANR